MVHDEGRDARPCTPRPLLCLIRRRFLLGFSEEVEHRFRRKLNTDFGKLNGSFRFASEGESLPTGGGSADPANAHGAESVRPAGRLGTGPGGLEERLSLPPRMTDTAQAPPPPPTATSSSSTRPTSQWSTEQHRRRQRDTDIVVAAQRPGSRSFASRNPSTTSSTS